MFIALNEKQERVCAEDATRKETYVCPICGNKVILRYGSINAAHFAHEENMCKDNWHYDMTPWHKRLQNVFPLKNQEIVVKDKEKNHRADVLINNTVIEIQHSSISADEFMDRNIFFWNLGYKVVWIFDMRERIYKNIITNISNDENKFKWSHPCRFFSALNQKIHDFDKHFAIYFHMFELFDDSYDINELFDDGKIDKIQYDSILINKIVWTKGSPNDMVDFSRFCTRDSIDMLSSDFSSDQLLLSQKDFIRPYFLNELHSLKENCKIDGFSYVKRMDGIPGKPQGICPRKNFNISNREFRGNWCYYCRYCRLIAYKNKKNFADELCSYCSYPYSLYENDPGEFIDNNGRIPYPEMFLI